MHRQQSCANSSANHYQNHCSEWMDSACVHAHAYKLQSLLVGRVGLYMEILHRDSSLTKPSEHPTSEEEANALWALSLLPAIGSVGFGSWACTAVDGV